MGSNNGDKTVVRDIIEGHEVCQTHDAAWLCLNNVYNHFQRPNFYDIGGTYMNNVPDFWFLYKTEQVSKLYLLHLYVCNRHECSFSVTLCNSNLTAVNERSNTVHLDSGSKMYTFENLSDSNYTYLTTYSFSELDVELMKDKNLFIAITLSKTPVKELQLPMEAIRRNHDFGQLLSDPVCADFTMVSADGTKFQVHKFLLAARSEVFKAMLKDDTAESINNVVTISDVNKEDLSCIIEFIYTGTVKRMESKNCFTILMLADRYDLKGLKALSQHALAQQLNNDNALETLVAADMYNSATLKTSALKYIKMNIASLRNSTFHEMNNIHLVQDLCKYLAMKY